MKIKQTLLYLIIALVSTHSGIEGTIQRYHSQPYLEASSGAFKTGLSGYFNPALLTYQDAFSGDFRWTSNRDGALENNSWAAFLAWPGFSIGGLTQESSLGSITDYRVSVSNGNRDLSFGAGIGWSSGNTKGYERTTVLTSGLLYRPHTHVSMGLSGAAEIGGNDSELIMDFGFRPYGDEKIKFICRLCS